MELINLSVRSYKFVISELIINDPSGCAVYRRSTARNAGSNSAEGMVVCVLYLLSAVQLITCSEE
jgi:hypothetical protein